MTEIGECQFGSKHTSKAFNINLKPKKNYIHICNGPVPQKGHKAKSMIADATDFENLVSLFKTTTVTFEWQELSQRGYNLQCVNVVQSH